MKRKAPVVKSHSLAPTVGKSVILLVEDEPLLVEMYSTVLKKLKGFTVMTAREEQTALEAIGAHHPALVLLDLMIPSSARRTESDYHEPVGLNVLKKIKSSPETKRTKVVILSNLDADEHRLRAEQLGADAYIVKAMVPPEELLRRVAALVQA